MAQKSLHHPVPAYGEVACGQWPFAAYGSGGPAAGDAIWWSSARLRNEVGDFLIWAGRDPLTILVSRSLPHFSKLCLEVTSPGHADVLQVSLLANMSTSVKWGVKTHPNTNVKDTSQDTCPDWDRSEEKSSLYWIRPLASPDQVSFPTAPADLLEAVWSTVADGCRIYCWNIFLSTNVAVSLEAEV